MDPYTPQDWHDFFLAVAGAAAALTGLLFVSLSLHVRYIASTTNHRNMARGSLIGLVGALVLSLLVLIRQPAQWAGVELATANVVYIVAVGAYQLSAFRRLNWKIPPVRLLRSGLGYVLALVGLVGGFDLYAGIGPGLYLIALQVIAIIIWNLRNAWFLLMGVADEDLVRNRTGKA